MQNKKLIIALIISTAVMIGSILFYFFYNPSTDLALVDVNQYNPNLSDDASRRSETFIPVSDEARLKIEKFGWEMRTEYMETSGEMGDVYSVYLKKSDKELSMTVSQLGGYFDNRSFSPDGKFIYDYSGKQVIDLDSGLITDFTDPICAKKVYKWTADGALLTFGQSDSSVGNSSACIFDSKTKKIIHNVVLSLDWSTDAETDLPIGDVNYYNHLFYVYKITPGDKSGKSCSVYSGVPVGLNNNLTGLEKLNLEFIKTVSDAVKSPDNKANFYCELTNISADGEIIKLGRTFEAD